MSAIPRASIATRGPALTKAKTRTKGARTDVNTAIPNFRPQKSINKQGELVGERKQRLIIQNRKQRGNGGGVIMQTRVGGPMDTPTQKRIMREKVAAYGSTRMVPTQILDPTSAEASGGDRTFDPLAPSMQDMSMIRPKGRDEIQRIMTRLRNLQSQPSTDQISSEILQLKEQLKAFSRSGGDVNKVVASTKTEPPADGAPAPAVVADIPKVDPSSKKVADLSPSSPIPEKKIADSPSIPPITVERKERNSSSIEEEAEGAQRSSIQSVMGGDSESEVEETEWGDDGEWGNWKDGANWDWNDVGGTGDTEDSKMKEAVEASRKAEDKREGKKEELRDEVVDLFEDQPNRSTKKKRGGIIFYNQAALHPDKDNINYPENLSSNSESTKKEKEEWSEFVDKRMEHAKKKREEEKRLQQKPPTPPIPPPPPPPPPPKPKATPSTFLDPPKIFTHEFLEELSDMKEEAGWSKEDKAKEKEYEGEDDEEVDNESQELKEARRAKRRRDKRREQIEEKLHNKDIDDATRKNFERMIKEDNEQRKKEERMKRDKLVEIVNQVSAVYHFTAKQTIDLLQKVTQNASMSDPSSSTNRKRKREDTASSSGYFSSKKFKEEAFNNSNITPPPPPTPNVDVPGPVKKVVFQNPKSTIDPEFPTRSKKDKRKREEEIEEIDEWPKSKREKKKRKKKEEEVVATILKSFTSSSLSTKEEIKEKIEEIVEEKIEEMKEEKVDPVTAPWNPLYPKKTKGNLQWAKRRSTPSPYAESTSTTSTPPKKTPSKAEQKARAMLAVTNSQLKKSHRVSTDAERRGLAMRSTAHKKRKSKLGLADPPSSAELRARAILAKYQK